MNRDFVYSIIEDNTYSDYPGDLIYDASEAVYRAVILKQSIAVLDAFSLEYYGEI